MDTYYNSDMARGDHDERECVCIDEDWMQRGTTRGVWGLLVELSRAMGDGSDNG